MTRFRLIPIACAITLAAIASQAQPIYRIVGPDGKITFSDKPPADSSGAKLEASGKPGTDSANANSDMPYTLRQTSAKFPVTLYTGKGCAPCESGRALLHTRGIPYTEKLVNTADDTAQLQKISGESSLPFLTIGAQHLQGFSAAEWGQYLDAAGYPATSQLPKGYKRPAASPLVAAAPSQPKAPPAAPRVAPEAAPPAPTGPNPSNPAGLTF